MDQWFKKGTLKGPCPLLNWFSIKLYLTSKKSWLIACICCILLTELGCQREMNCTSVSLKGNCALHILLNWCFCSRVRWIILPGGGWGSGARCITALASMWESCSKRWRWEQRPWGVLWCCKLHIRKKKAETLHTESLPVSWCGPLPPVPSPLEMALMRGVLVGATPYCSWRRKYCSLCSPSGFTDSTSVFVCVFSVAMAEQEDRTHYSHQMASLVSRWLYGCHPSPAENHVWLRPCCSLWSA